MNKLLLMKREEFLFNGLKYVRQPGKRYFLRSFWDKTQKRVCGESLHRDIWKFHNGEISYNHDVHHVDGDWHNNDISNLQCLSETEHIKLHNVLHELNKTKESIKWKIDAANILWSKVKFKKYVCGYCGYPFESRKTTPAKYCSLICNRRAKNNTKPLICKVCKKEFWNKGAAFCCSKECNIKYRTVDCAVCGEPFERKYKAYLCCSRKCAGKYRKNRKRM